MVNVEFPHNRLQKRLYDRWRKPVVLLTVLIVSVLFALLFTKPTWAVGDRITNYYSPPNYPNAPSNLWNGNFASSGACVGHTCSWYWWIGGVGGAHVSTSDMRVCLAGIRTDLGSTDTISISLTSTSWTDYTPTRANAGLQINGGVNQRCWNGSTWVAVGGYKLLPYMNDSGLTNSILTPVTITSINGGTSDYKGNYGFNSTPDDTVMLSPNWGGPTPGVATLTNLTASGSMYVGQNTQFKAFHSGLAFSGSYLYFYNNSGSTVQPLTIIANRPLPSAGYNFFNYSYTTTGRKYPYVVFGNSSCTTITSTGAIAGAGCVQKRGDLIEGHLTITGQTQLPASFSNGGGNGNYVTGTGALFVSDKNYYTTTEPAFFKWIFNNTFSVGSVYLYSSSGGTVLWHGNDVSDVIKGATHYQQVTFPTPGTFQPILEVRSTSYAANNPATYARYYLGGTTYPNPDYVISVIKQIAGIPIDTGSTIDIYHNTVPLTQSTQSGALTQTDNIFGVLLQNFNFTAPFGQTGNWFLDTAQSVLGIVLYGAFWVASKVYGVLMYSSILNFLFSSFHAVNGATYTIGSTIFGYAIPSALVGKTFTISYYNGAASVYINELIHIAILISIFTWSIEHFLFHKKK